MSGCCNNMPPWIICKRIYEEARKQSRHSSLSPFAFWSIGCTWPDFNFLFFLSPSTRLLYVCKVHFLTPGSSAFNVSLYSPLDLLDVRNTNTDISWSRPFTKPTNDRRKEKIWNWNHVKLIWVHFNFLTFLTFLTLFPGTEGDLLWLSLEDVHDVVCVRSSVKENDY